jgi:hypothetical protein
MASPSTLAHPARALHLWVAVITSESSRGGLLEEVHNLDGTDFGKPNRADTLAGGAFSCWSGERLGMRALVLRNVSLPMAGYKVRKTDLNRKPQAPVDLPKSFSEDSLRILASRGIYSFSFVPPLSIGGTNPITDNVDGATLCRSGTNVSLLKTAASHVPPPYRFDSLFPFAFSQRAFAA